MQQEILTPEPRIHDCYVDECDMTVNLDKDQYCIKDLNGDGVYRFRHLWHGVPGITRTAPCAGVVGYARTLADAKRRALYFIQDNPYAAPETKQQEQMILDEVERIENLSWQERLDMEQ